jgi:hypothetical protein
MAIQPMDYFFGGEKFHHLVTKRNSMGLVYKGFLGGNFSSLGHQKKSNLTHVNDFCEKMHQNY